MKKLTVGIFCLLYILVSFVSTIHIINFFELSNSHWLSVTLGIAFELGSAASLCSIAFLDKANKYIVWGLFILLTLFQIQANAWTVFANVHDYRSWVELFWLNDASEIIQKRVLAIVSGAILPIVALGFIKSLVDYMKSGSTVSTDDTVNDTKDEIPANFDFKSALANIKDLESDPGFVNAKIPENSGPVTEVEQEVVSNINVVDQEVKDNNNSIEHIDDQILRNRQLAEELVSTTTSTPETKSSQQIDNADSKSAIAVSADAKVSRGQQIYRG